MVRRFDTVSSSGLHSRKLSGHREYVDSALADCHHSLLFATNIMKIGFVSLYGPGHFNPMSALARQLQSRHHNVVMLSLPFIEPLARAANLPFIPFGAEGFSGHGER